MLDSVSTLIGIFVAVVSLLGGLWAIYRRSLKSKIDMSLKEKDIENKLKDLEDGIEVCLKKHNENKIKINEMEKALHTGEIRYSRVAQVIKALSSSQKDIEQDLKELLKILYERD